MIERPRDHWLLGLQFSLKFSIATPSGLGIIHLVEVGDESWSGWVPIELLLGDGAGSRDVSSCEVSEKAEVLGCLFAGFGDYRDVEAASEGFGDFAKLYSLFADGVVAGSGGSFFQGEPVQAGAIEDVTGGPAVESIADVG